MNRRRFLLVAAVALVPAHAVWAVDLGDRIVDQLKAQGYHDITIRRTLLGRVRITGVSDKYQREIVVNPRTGEILRDYWEGLEGGGDAQGQDEIFDPNDDSHNGSGNGSSGGGGSAGGGGSDDTPNHDDNGGDDHNDDPESDDGSDGHD